MCEEPLLAQHHYPSAQFRDGLLLHEEPPFCVGATEIHSYLSATIGSSFEAFAAG